MPITVSTVAQPVVTQTETTQSVVTTPNIDTRPKTSTVLYPGFRDANPNSIQSSLNQQDSMASAERERQNLQGTRHGTGWTAAPIPKKIIYPTITGETEVKQKNITTEFSEKVTKIINFSKFHDQVQKLWTPDERKHWDALDKIQGKDTKLNYMKKNNLSGGIWDAAKWSFENSNLPTAREVRSNQLQTTKQTGVRKENR